MNLSLSSKTKQRLSVADKYGTTPLDILMEIATSPESSREEIISCAVAAAPYCHARLKQIDVRVDDQRRPPSEIERDITHLIEQLGVAATAKRDLVGLAPRVAGSSAV